MVLTFNFRGFGKSQGKKDIALAPRDLKGALRFMASKGAAKIAVVGASMGGTAALVTASDHPVAAVASLSAPDEFEGLDAVSAVQKVTSPMLFVAATGDGQAANDAERLYRSSGDPAAGLELVPGEAHGTQLLDGDSGKKVRPLVEKFLKESFA